MSDYLQNLVTRSLNLTRVVQPRLASLFEPTEGGGRFASASSFDAQGIDAEAQTAEAAPSVDQRSTTPMLTPRAVMTQSPAPSAQLSAEPHAAAPTRITSTDTQAEASAAEQLFKPVEPPLQHFPPVATSPASDALKEREKTEARAASTLEDEIKLVVNSEAARAEPTAGDRQESREASQARAHVVEPRLAPAPTHATQSPQPSVETPTAESDAPPTIHVTIGRVDVRAVVSNAPQGSRTAPARPRPALSLEGYLRQPKGGAR